MKHNKTKHCFVFDARPPNVETEPGVDTFTGVDPRQIVNLATPESTTAVDTHNYVLRPQSCCKVVEETQFTH